MRQVFVIREDRFGYDPEGDTPDWFESLKPPADEPSEKRFFYYEVY